MQNNNNKQQTTTTAIVAYLGCEENGSSKML